MNKGTLIILSGLPGSGKSTYAEKLKDERNAVVLWPDYWAKSLVKNINDKEEYHRIRLKIKELFFELMQQLLKTGTTVVIERGFWKEEQREKYLKVAKELNSHVELYFFDAPLEVLWERIEKRNMTLPSGSISVSFDELKHWHEILEIPTNEELQKYDSWKIITNDVK